MDKLEFNRIVKTGRETGEQFMIVKIETEGNPSPELIVNDRKNFDAKLSYYNSAYNDDMELIAAKNNGKSIRITGVLMTSNFDDLHWFIWQD